MHGILLVKENRIIAEMADRIISILLSIIFNACCINQYIMCFVTFHMKYFKQLKLVNQVIIC